MLAQVDERRFAVHGIDAVALRSMAIEAGADIAAVHHHVGSKVDLIRALVSRPVRVAALLDERVTPR